MIIESICGDEYCQEETEDEEENTSRIAVVLPTIQEVIKAIICRQLQTLYL